MIEEFIKKFGKLGFYIIVASSILTFIISSFNSVGFEKILNYNLQFKYKIIQEDSSHNSLERNKLIVFLKNTGLSSLNNLRVNVLATNIDIKNIKELDSIYFKSIEVKSINPYVNKKIEYKNKLYPGELVEITFLIKTQEILYKGDINNDIKLNVYSEEIEGIYNKDLLRAGYNYKYFYSYIFVLMKTSIILIVIISLFIFVAILGIAIIRKLSLKLFKNKTDKVK